MWPRNKRFTDELATGMDSTANWPEGMLEKFVTMRFNANFEASVISLLCVAKQILHPITSQKCIFSRVE